MILTFYWKAQFATLEPACRSDTLNRDGLSVLACLLEDTGGLPYLSTLPWLEEGLRLSAAVKRGDDEPLTWGREDWAASLRKDGATIYSLHVADYSEVIELDAFESALRAWLAFIQQAPDPNLTSTLALSR